MLSEVFEWVVEGNSADLWTLGGIEDVFREDAAALRTDAKVKPRLNHAPTVHFCFVSTNILRDASTMTS